MSAAPQTQQVIADQQNPAPPASPVIDIPLSAPPPLEASSFDHVSHYVEEIKSMREEINWRVKVAYNGSIIFISALSVIGGTLFSTDNKFLDSIKTDPAVMTLSGVGILIAVSSWVGVQNANHLIEKRIELYTLELMKLVHAQTGHVQYSWLGFLYGSLFFKKEVKNRIAKFLYASIGMFIYLLPNAVSIGVWIYLFFNGQLDKYKWLFICGTVFLLVAAGSTLMFFFYVMKVNRNFSEFYKTRMKPYFENRGFVSLSPQ